MNSFERKWTTHDEIAWLNHPSIGRVHEGAPFLTRREVLENYRIAAGRRADWGDMDRNRIMAALSKAIHQEAAA